MTWTAGEDLAAEGDECDGGGVEGPAPVVRRLAARAPQQLQLRRHRAAAGASLRVGLALALRVARTRARFLRAGRETGRVRERESSSSSLD